ncbi:MAG TPA: hypothetical protein VFE56_03215 [Candidatus Binataceae bacterium]|jgi:hypothetical protein|nr:hypothetical protein [Candidatus Binataceae bacterium]
MPAHLGFADKLNMFAAFMTVNLSQSEGAQEARRLRVSQGDAARERQGLEATSNRAAYVPWKKVKGSFEHYRGRREFPVRDYGDFRRLLNNYNPDQQVNRTGLHSDQNEWDLYLRPGTAFDQNCQAIFEGQRGTGFKAVLIVHKSEREKLKRIEGVFPSGRVVIWWSDAS